MYKIQRIIAGILIVGTSVSAQQVNIFGKVTDIKGAALDSVVMRLAKHPAITSTTGKNGLFSLTGKINAAIIGLRSATTQFVQCNGKIVRFSVNQPQHVAVEIFTLSGRRLAKPLDNIVPPGAYALPIMNASASQILLVRVQCGNDVYRFLTQGARSYSLAGGASVCMYADPASQKPSVLKSSALSIDTLIFSRNGYAQQSRAIASYTPGDSIKVSLQSVTTIKAKVIAAADSIMLAVQKFRGKNFKRTVSVSVYTRSQYKAFAGGQISSSTPQAQKDLYNKILRLEGLLRANQDYFASYDSALSGQTAGFYVPGSDSLYVILGDTATGLEFQDSLTIFHELVHALQDQYFDLTTIVDSNAMTDQYYTGHYVIEGEAELLMDYYGFKLTQGAYPTSATSVVNYLNQEQIAMDAYLDSIHQAGNPLLSSMPELWEYYSYGPKFISAVVGMNWPLIDTKIFPAFPTHTFEVLEPQTYAASNEYMLNVQSLENYVVNSNYIVDEDDLGELLSMVMFREWNFSSYRDIPSGMMADNIMAYRSLQSDSLRLIWNTYWQDSSAAANFFTSYASLVGKKRNIQLPAPTHSGKYSYISDTHNNIYIEQSKSYVFTLEDYQTSTLNNLTTLCRAIQPYKTVALAKTAAEQASKQPRVSKHRPHGGRPHPAGGARPGLR